MESLEERILNALEELGEDTFSAFKERLRHPDNLQGLKPIRWSELENADRLVTKRLIKQAYTSDDAPQVMRNVLEKINRTDLLKCFPEMCKDAAHPSTSKAATTEVGGSKNEGSNKKKHKVCSGQTSVRNSEKISREQHQIEVDELLFRLNLKDNYQQKLTTADFLKIGPSINAITERDLAHAFLQKLLMLDHRARYIRVYDQIATEKGFFAISDSSNENTDQNMNQCHVHPMDVQMAVFHCSDSFLRQNMITKLSQCQYALPLLVPDPFTRDIECPLWTFRQIRKSWKSGAITSKNVPIYQAETPMVSFLRFGSVSSPISKSQIMNLLINAHHSTFFDSNCPGATKSHCLIDGMAEIAWYCPAGKPSDAFSDCVAFCNLHGDARTHDKQREILIDKASVNVVLFPTLRTNDKIRLDLLPRSPSICLVADNDKVAECIFPGKYIMGVKDRSQSDVAEELKGILRYILTTSEKSFQLESMGDVPGIRIDEDDPACQTGKSAALQIMDLLERMELSQIKDTFLPCQGQQFEKDKLKKQEKLKEIRRKQRDIPASELMQWFIENMQSLKCNEKLYFLKWIELFIDKVSTDKVSEIHKYYASGLNKKKEKHGNLDELETKKGKLEEMSNTHWSVAFGVEHILREIGQLYEAHAPCTDIEKWSQYPKLAAELMIAGQPIELMDGDTAHVPLQWLTSVLDEVIKTLGDKRVFVLSVLGIQSSGKSTMLNAMFGLQFAVSAGRSTRGAFMQLVEVSKEIQKDFKFDYVLVVDTAGLCAPELAGQETYNHDNALATFVIGLGNMTLVNITGDNPSEMQDVLHMFVQALMRMTKVDLSPRCVFVHQNVAPIEAGEKIKEVKRRLQENLDDMTKLAAKEEEFDAEFFSDVIAFDVEKDVKYISQLWEESTPMAPPNPGYSENIQELKNMILSKAKESNGMTLSKFTSTIKDLWNSLLNENFILSLYRKLGNGEWTWALRKEMLTIENQLLNKIENGGFDGINMSDLIKEIDKTWEEVEKAVNQDKYIVLVQWKTRFETKIKDFRDELVRGTKQKLEKIIQERNARRNMDDKKTVYENQLLQKSKELASKLKDKAKDENELQKEFNSLWKGWVTELTAGVPRIKEIDIQKDVDSILLDMGFEWTLLTNRRTHSLYKDITKRGDYSDCIASKHNKLSTDGFTKSYKMVALWFSSTKECNYNDLIRALIFKVETQTNVLIKKKSLNTIGYHIGHMHEVAYHVKEQVKDFESLVALKKEFKLDLLLNACTIAMASFQNTHNEFQKSNDARAYLENQKGQYYKAFKSFCEGSSSAAVLGELLCSKLKKSAVQHVCEKTALDLAGEMKCSHPPFSENRVNLEKHVLKSLANEEDFKSYMNYITHPREQVEQFIKKAVEEYMSTNKAKVLCIMKKNVDDIAMLLCQAVHGATEKVKTKRGDTNMWLKEFSSPLRDYRHVATNCYDHFNDINNFDFLKEEIEKHLKSMKEDLNKLSINVVDVHVTPDQILIDQLCNCCWVQCPFCSAICTNTLEDHSPDKHSVPFHRPGAVQGRYYRGSVEFDIDSCTTMVASDRCFYTSSGEAIPYKEYRSGGPEYANWSITPDESKLTYWKWFVCRFQKELEEHYGKTFKGRGELPEAWKYCTKQEAIESLENM